MIPQPRPQPPSTKDRTARPSSSLLLAVVLLSVGLTFFRCSVPDSLDGESLTLVYELDWRRGTPSRQTTSNLGYEVTIDRGYLVTRGLQLVPCNERHTAPQTAASTWPNLLDDLLDLGPALAWAGHDSGAADPSAIPKPVVEDLLAANSTTEIREINAGSKYCKVHYLIARSTAAAEPVAGIELAHTSLFLEGHYRHVREGSRSTAQPFTLRSSLANGATVRARGGAGQGQTRRLPARRDAGKGSGRHVRRRRLRPDGRSHAISYRSEIADRKHRGHSPMTRRAERIRDLFLVLSLALIWTPVLLETESHDLRVDEPIQLAFELSFDGLPWSCTEPSEGGFELVDLRLFVHDVELRDSLGNGYPFALIADGRWQTDRVALLDFTNQSGSCEGSEAVRRSLVGATRMPEGASVEAVRFTLGLPSSLNHDNPAIAPPPLSAGQMHWSWQSGYKFTRFEARHLGRAVRLHLGSTHCDGPIGAVDGCGRENRARVELSMPYDLHLAHGTARARQGLWQTQPDAR